jgi:nitrate/nitrite-specific signal transduction histidine kinase
MSKSDEKPPVPEADLVASKREFIETFFKRGAEFAEELMHENERLRFRVAQLEQAVESRGSGERTGSAQMSLRELVSRIESLEHEREQLLSRYQGVELQNQSFSSRYHEIERENNNLANLYVASFQLHSTMELREVTQIIVEILINFVGAKTFAIQLLDAEHGRLKTLAAEGIDRAHAPGEGAPPTGGMVAEVMRSGNPFFDDARLVTRADPARLSQPVIVAPLKIREQVVGVIVVWDLLQQKTALQEVDYELFNLLGAHAASALQGAKLTAELEGRPPALWAAADLV